MMKARQSFSREFKLEAVRLMDESKRPEAEIARELGVGSRHYSWTFYYLAGTRWPYPEI